MKVSNKYKKKDFSYLLYNNPSKQNKDGNPLPILKQYNSEDREKAIYRLYFCQGGKVLSESEQRERKRVFKKLGFTNDLLDKLFIEYKANLISSTKNQIYLFQNQDKWRIVRRNDLLYLYHNNYYVSGDGTRYIVPGFHIQGVFSIEHTYKIVTKIVGYNWDTHKNIYLGLASCFVS